MISYLKGKYIDRTEEGNIILNVNGIGFEVSVTGEVLGRVAYNNTDEIELFTYMQVKEDGMALYYANSSSFTRAFYSTMIGPSYCLPKLWKGKYIPQMSKDNAYPKIISSSYRK